MLQLKNLEEYNKGHIALAILVSMIIFAVGIKLGTETILVEYQASRTYQHIELVRSNSNNTEVTAATTNKDLLNRLMSAKIKTEDGKEVQLVKGGADISLQDDQGKYTLKGFAGLGDIALLHVGPNGTYVLTYGFVNTGGTGNFVQLWLFKETKKGLTFLSSQFVEDRVPVLGLRLDESDESADSKILQAYARIKIRNSNDPMSAEPTNEKMFTATIDHEVFKPDSALIQ